MKFSGKMVYDPTGCVFWDETAGIRRWNQIYFDKTNPPVDSVYQVIALPDSALSWAGKTSSFAVVDDFGNLVRIK